MPTTEKSRAYRRKWYAEHRDYFREYHKKWREKNHDRMLEQAKRHYAKHRDKIRAYAKEYRKRDPERTKLLDKQRRSKRVEKMKEWGRRALYRVTPEKFAAMMEKQGKCCAICGIALAKKSNITLPHIDHAVVDHRAHVRGILCQRCNMALGMFGDDPAILERAIAYLDNFALESAVNG